MKSDVGRSSNQWVGKFVVLKKTEIAMQSSKAPLLLSGAIFCSATFAPGVSQRHVHFTVARSFLVLFDVKSRDRNSNSQELPLFLIRHPRWHFGLELCWNPSL